MTKKTFGQRFLSGLTSVMMSVMSIAGSVSASVPIRAADGDEVPPIFSVDASALGWFGANSIYAEIDFANISEEEVNVTIPDNTYYLLIHAVGAAYSDWTGTSYTYDDGSETKDHYKLIELEASDGVASWSSGQFGDVLPGKEADNGWGS